MGRPTNAVIDQEESAIEGFLRRHSAGLSLPELASATPELLGHRLPERTLARRVTRLMDRGRVISTGAARSTRYHAVRATEPLAVREVGADPKNQSFGPAPRPVDTRSEAVGQRVPEPGYLPLSSAGTDVWRMMQRPLIERQPTGYERGFLEAYAPGTSWYLPSSTRAHLHELGRSREPQRPAGTWARDILGYLLIDLAWASSRLEGNTYTRLDTQNLIEFGQRAEGRDLAEAQMILNHKAALEFLVVEADDISFNRRTLLTLHALLSENLLRNAADEGRLRVHPVGITGTTFLPTGIPQVIEDCFGTLLTMAAAIPDPFEQAFFVMVHIPYLQPFSDVNKRTSRLAANIPLVRGNLCPLSFVDVPRKAYVDGLMGVYELRRIDLFRDVFVWAYERSCAQYRVVRDSIATPDPVRLRYREELAALVRATVLGGDAPRKSALRTWGESNGVAAADLDVFAEAALDILVNLREGTAGRYRLRPSELAAWRGKFSG